MLNNISYFFEKRKHVENTKRGVQDEVKRVHA
jgi:hypothetical protein